VDEAATGAAVDPPSRRAGSGADTGVEPAGSPASGRAWQAAAEAAMATAASPGHDRRLREAADCANGSAVRVM
jgi:hypothetical protein